jgi:hypothetical protein
MSDTPWWDIRPGLNKTADEHARRLNFIWRQIIDPCDAPITVWLWAFWPAFWHLVLQWYTIDISQILIAYLRPGFRAFGARNKRHWGGGQRGRRPGGKKGRLNPLNFDPNEFIGSEILGWDEIPGKGPFPGELWFWTIEGLIERVQFYWMVMDLGTEFLYEWASAVARTSYCHARDDGVLLATAPGYPQSGIFGWDAMGILDAVKIRNIDFWNGYGVSSSVGPGQVLATASMQCIIEGAGGGYAMLRVRCLTGPRAGLTMEVREDVTAGGTVSLAATGPTGAFEGWIAEIKVNGLFNIIGPTLNYHAIAPNPE